MEEVAVRAGHKVLMEVDYYFGLFGLHPIHLLNIIMILIGYTVT